MPFAAQLLISAISTLRRLYRATAIATLEIRGTALLSGSRARKRRVRPEAYSEEDVQDRTEAVFVHVFRAYPTVPSPYYAGMALQTAASAPGMNLPG